MQLFEILQDGFHTPLTAEQIAELFQAGRLNRRTPCKPVKQRAWRTIDELFPLLKYHAPWRLGYQSPEPDCGFRFRRAVVVGTGLVVAAAAALVVYLSIKGESPAGPRITTIDRTVSAYPIQTVTPPSTPSAFPSVAASQVFAVPVAQTNSQYAIRAAEARRAEEQAGRDQVVAEQQRAMHQQMLLEQKKAAGRDQHVLLDHRQIVDVGGQSVSVQIHDNDTTSFDVWIDGNHYRGLRKEKGITGTRADETLIYSNGRAALYYVWEISGRINHCLLRVRDT